MTDIAPENGNADIMRIKEEMERRRKAAVALVRMQRQGHHVSHIRAVSLVATSDGMAQWLGKLESPTQLGRASELFAIPSSMPDNSAPRSKLWNAVSSAMLHDGDQGAFPLLKSALRLDLEGPQCRLECLHGLDSVASGWSLLHKVVLAVDVRRHFHRLDFPFPTLQSVAFDCPKCTNLLLNNAMNPDIQDREGTTPDHVARWFNRSEYGHAFHH
jgi:hypothetical protein